MIYQHEKTKTFYRQNKDGNWEIRLKKSNKWVYFRAGINYNYKGGLIALSPVLIVLFDLEE
jgi:hypothetical protein